MTLLDRIAVGGMSEVFHARESSGASVVVKRMFPSLATEPATRAMFEAEARVGLAVEHPNVVRVLGAGEEDGVPYLVLEHVAGLDLSRITRFLTRRSATLGIAVATYLVRRMLLGLHAVHEARDVDGAPLGVVHRDVSPSNVLVSVTGEVKLGDFGIAQSLLRQSFPQATSTPRTRGKIGYLAPEQVRGGESDRRADVFASGVVCAELLMGKPLFGGGSELAILLAIRDGHLEPFEEIAPTLPAGLAETVRRALRREPRDRTASALELAHALAPFEPAPEAGLREELAALVKTASVDRLPSGALPAVRRDGKGSHTAPPPANEYEVHTPSGVLGPFSYARLVEAVATGDVGPDDRVAVRGEAPVALSTHPDLVRHLPPSSLSELTADRAAPSRPDRGVDLAGSRGILPILGALTLERETGLLLCVQAGVRKEVYLEEGVPEFVTSNVASELLGEFLVARAVISRGELDMALAVMPRFEGRLGDTLTALGLVEPVLLFRQIASQVEEKLLDLFGWTSGQATFYRGVARPTSGFPLGLDAWRILVDGTARRVAAGIDPERVAARLSSQVESVRPSPRGLAAAPLGPGLRRAVERALRPMPLAHVFDDRGRDEARAVRDATLLLGLGAIRWVAGP